MAVRALHGRRRRDLGDALDPAPTDWIRTRHHPRKPESCGPDGHVLRPRRLGTQEASLLVVGAAVGVPAHAALALAIARRARQLGLGIPSITAWFISERRAP